MSKPESEVRVRTVFERIGAVQAKIAERGGIAKAQYNDQQRYYFRGIDDVYNAVARLLPAEGLVMSPDILERTMEVRATKSGGANYHVVLKVEVWFHCADFVEGGAHSMVVYGEGMDTGDKATAKALSAAVKSALLSIFTVPTADIEDPDKESPEETAPPKLEQHQIDEIKELLKTSGADSGILLRSLKVDSVESIPVDQYDRVIRSLTKKLNGKTAEVQP